MTKGKLLARSVVSLIAFTSVAASIGVGFAQDAEEGVADEVRPSPPSIGADVPVTYFGPPPSSVEPELIGPRQLLTAGELNESEGTITLPLYEGRVEGETFWYVVTDTTDGENARALGINHAPKLAYADNCRGVRMGHYDERGVLEVDRGTVDFSPERVIVPGEKAPFPPQQAEPGSRGDEFYTPLVMIQNAGEHIYNAPVLAMGDPAELDFCEGDVDHHLVHDKVTKFCPEEGTVTLALTAGFSFAKPVLYLSTEANDPLPAALEGATFAPGLRDVPIGRDDSLYSAVERIFSFANGPTNVVDDEVNPQRQGLNSALSGEGGPLNVLGGIPTVATDYSPLWDLNLGEWTQDAIDAGYRTRLTEEFQILGMVERGHVTGPGGAAYGSTGFIVNCPIVHRFL